MQPEKGRGVMFRQSCPNLYHLTNGPIHVYWIGIRQPVPLFTNDTRHTFGIPTVVLFNDRLVFSLAAAELWINFFYDEPLFPQKQRQRTPKNLGKLFTQGP